MLLEIRKEGARSSCPACPVAWKLVIHPHLFENGYAAGLSEKKISLPLDAGKVPKPMSQRNARP
jgi:hypothetical protein